MKFTADTETLAYATREISAKIETHCKLQTHIILRPKPIKFHSLHSIYTLYGRVTILGFKLYVTVGWCCCCCSAVLMQDAVLGPCQITRWFKVPVGLLLCIKSTKIQNWIFRKYNFLALQWYKIFRKILEIIRDIYPGAAYFKFFSKHRFKSLQLLKYPKFSINL